MEENKDIEIEKKVLGILISEPKLLTEQHSKLSVNLFSVVNHQIIFQEINEIWQKSQTLDLLILQREFTKKNLSELIPHCIELVANTITSAHIEFYIMILAQLSAKRDFIEKFSNLLNIAKNPSKDIFDVRDKAFDVFDNLFIDRFIENNKQEQPFSSLIAKVQEKFENIKKGRLTGLPSSLNIINQAFGGWQNSDLSIVAGRPGMGKTAFLVQQVVDIATQNKAVGIFSLEMSAEQISARILSNYTEISNSSILRKGLEQDEVLKYLSLKDDLINLKIHIDETPSISIQNLRIKAKMMKLKHHIEILFVDYLQLITNEKAKNREQEISSISRELKAIAKDLNIPVVALSQLSRNVEQRIDKRPFLSDLRDSGAIEQDADEVLFLYRPEYYGIETWGKDYKGENTENQVEIIIQKNRHGRVFSDRCKVNMAISKFTNFDDIGKLFFV